MKDRMKMRADHRKLLLSLVEESGLRPSAIAKRIKVAPSTLNRVIEDNPDYKWVLSTPTLERLAEFRKGLGRPEAVKEVKLGRDALQKALDAELLRIWGRLDDNVKEAALGLFDAFLTMITRKVAQPDNVSHSTPPADKDNQATQ